MEAFADEDNRIRRRSYVVVYLHDSWDVVFGRHSIIVYLVATAWHLLQWPIGHGVPDTPSLAPETQNPLKMQETNLSASRIGYTWR